MRGRRGTAEAPQDQAVVRVFPCIPDRYILEQTTVYAQYVVGLGVHLPSAPVHGPCLAILQTQLVLWEEVAARVLQALLRQVRFNPLVLPPSLWCG